MNRVVRLLLAGLGVCLAVKVGAEIIGPVLPDLVALLLLAVVVWWIFARSRLRP